MRFPVYFKRQKGAGPNPAIGSDAVPVVTTEHGNTSKDNVLQLRISGLAVAVARIAVGFWYEGAGAAAVLPVTVWVWDSNSSKWYKASSGSLTNGEITYLKLPVLADPPQTSANMGNPNAGGVEAMIVIADNAIGDGVLHVVAGPDTAQA